MSEKAIFKSDNEKGPYRLDLEQLQEILLAEDVRDTPVIPISVIGEHRSAKGVLMNAIYAFLKKKDCTGLVRLSNAEMYQHTKDEAQHGPGCRIWEKLTKKIKDVKTDAEVIILLMVSQVSIIDEGTPNETKSILALVSCLSSVNILNVKEQLHEADLLRAREILEFSRPDSRFMIAIQKYDEAEGAETYFQRISKISDSDTQFLKETKKMLRKEKNLKCYGFPDSKCERDPEKRPDLDVKFLKKVTEFVKKEMTDFDIKSGVMTGKEIFRLGEELNHAIAGRNVTDITHNLFREVRDKTNGMLLCESAFEECMRQASCDTIADEKALFQLEKEAEKAAYNEADQLAFYETCCWKRVKENNQKLFENFEEAGRNIRDAVRRLHLKQMQSPSLRHTRMQHPEDEGSDTSSERGEFKDIGHINEDGPVSTKRRCTKRRNRK